MRIGAVQLRFLGTTNLGLRSGPHFAEPNHLPVFQLVVYKQTLIQALCAYQ